LNAKNGVPVTKLEAQTEKVLEVIPLPSVVGGLRQAAKVFEDEGVGGDGANSPSH
jgi:hypothetical protein